MAGLNAYRVVAGKSEPNQPVEVGTLSAWCAGKGDSGATLCCSAATSICAFKFAGRDVAARRDSAWDCLGGTTGFSTNPPNSNPEENNEPGKARLSRIC